MKSNKILIFLLSSFILLSLIDIVKTESNLSSGESWANPAIVEEVHVGGTSRSIQIHSNLGYVACSDYMLTIIDVTIDTTSSNPVGTVFPGASQDVFVVNKTAYVGSDASGLVLINITDPASPVPINNHVEAGMFCVGVYVRNDIAFVSFAWGSGADKLVILNVSNPNSIVKLGEETLGGRSSGILR